MYIAEFGVPGDGVFPQSRKIKVRNSTATTLVAGEVAILDAAQASFAPGHATAAGVDDSFFNNVLRPSSVNLTKWGQAVLIENDILTGAVGYGIPMAGPVPAIVNCSTTFPANTPLMMYSNSATLGLRLLGALNSAGTTQGEKVVALALAAVTTSTGAGSTTKIPVWFIGFGAGFGQNAS